MMPSREDREFALWIYMRARENPSSLPSQGTAHCIHVALQVANRAADLFGLPRYSGDINPRPGETALEYIDRVAADLARWRDGFGVREPGEERTVHRPERRSVHR